MNQINAEANIVEFDSIECLPSILTETQDAIIELDAAQLSLVGGGTVSVVLI